MAAANLPVEAMVRQAKLDAKRKFMRDYVLARAGSGHWTPNSKAVIDMGEAIFDEIERRCSDA